MATRERQSVYQGLKLTVKSNPNAPFKPPRSAMLQSQNAINSTSANNEPGSTDVIEDIYAPPKSSSDEEDFSANIKHTQFGPRAKSRAETDTAKSNVGLNAATASKVRNVGLSAKPSRPGRTYGSPVPMGWTPGARHLMKRSSTHGSFSKMNAKQSSSTERKPPPADASDSEESVELESTKVTKRPVGTGGTKPSSKKKRRSESSSPATKLIDFDDFHDTPEKNRFNTPEAQPAWIDPRELCDSISPEQHSRGISDSTSPMPKSTFIRPDYLSDDCLDSSEKLSPADANVKPSPLLRKSSGDSKFSERIQRHSSKKRRKKTKKEDSDDEKQPAFMVPEGSDITDTTSEFKPADFGEDDTLLDHVPEVARAMAKEDGYGDLFNGLDKTGTRSSFLVERDTNSAYIRGAVCPICNETVDEADLKAWTKTTGKKSMDFAQQTRFCREHQKKSAKSRWKSKGYPEIDWDGLDARVSKQHSLIEAMIRGAPCHHRTVLDEAVKSGKHRTLKEMSTGLVPGYYGSRGLRVMQENIMKVFSRLLKERAIKDKLISARGVPSFVQAVLVLEVACVLIMEDMDISEDEARNVLKDSIHLGELVNDEVKEFVRKRASSEDELSG